MTEIDCPRAKTWMTPCIARDGRLALSDGRAGVCVGCGRSPGDLLRDLAERYPAALDGGSNQPQVAADRLRDHVADYVEQRS
jgi:hypothetical protein